MMRACIISMSALLMLSAVIVPVFLLLDDEEDLEVARRASARERARGRSMRRHASNERCKYPRYQAAISKASQASSGKSAGKINLCELHKWRRADRPPPAMGHHRPASGSRASVERMVGSGSEPIYLPLTNTSCAGLELYFLGAASALDAVATASARASAILVNMVVSPAGWTLCAPAFRTHHVAR